MIPTALTMLQRLPTGGVPVAQPEAPTTRAALSSRSYSYIEDGTQIRRTDWVIRDRDLTLIERLKSDEAAKKLTYTYHLSGPKTNHQFELDIDLT
jgi:hypothetical protein